MSRLSIHKRREKNRRKTTTSRRFPRMSVSHAKSVKDCDSHIKITLLLIWQCCHISHEYSFSRPGDGGLWAVDEGPVPVFSLIKVFRGGPGSHLVLSSTSLVNSLLLVMSISYLVYSLLYTLIETLTYNTLDIFCIDKCFVRKKKNP